MAAARYLRLWRCWRPGGFALLGPARRRVYAACSSASPGAWWAPRGPAPSPLAGLSTAPRRHLRGPGSLGGGDGLESGGAEDGGGGADPAGAPPAMTALTPLLIPERFPNVPLIAVTRNPVFPRFIKILEVTWPEPSQLLCTLPALGRQSAWPGSLCPCN
uniref:Lon N-terminal domain-containing protein n=1 Tax=Chelydra serpentina TaxID=8475 RepID=A0A8C3SD22_CHESE